MKTTKTVCVLLSTFNGEKYLQEQLDSLYRQKDVQIKICARDDGSCDGTSAMLEQNRKSHPNLSYTTGENVGLTKSFFALLTHAPQADYYAFCDQDDVWDEDKLAAAIKAQGTCDENAPWLYHSNLRVVDENLVYFRNAHSKTKALRHNYEALVIRGATGCTVVINKAAKDMIVQHLPQTCAIYDTWIFTCCSLFGNVYYDPQPHISYRQHQTNAIGTGLKKWGGKRLARKYREWFVVNPEPIYKNANGLYEQFADELSEDDKELALKIIHYKDGLRSRLRLMTDKRVRGRTPAESFVICLKILMGAV